MLVSFVSTATVSCSTIINKIFVLEFGESRRLVYVFRWLCLLALSIGLLGSVTEVAQQVVPPNELE